MTESKLVEIEVIKDFKYAHRGCDVREYVAGSTVEVSEDCAELAIKEKWAKTVKSAGKTKAEKNGNDPEPAAGE